MQQVESGVLTTAAFVADFYSIQRDPHGAQVDWDRTSAARKHERTGRKRIPAGTVMSRLASGKVVPRADFSLVPSALTQAAGTVTATFAAPHGLQTGDRIAVEGASDGYNGTFEIEVVDATTIKYSGVASGTASPAASEGTVSIAASEILASGAEEGDTTAAMSGYGTLIGAVLYENVLPDATGTPRKLAAAIKAELADSGCHFNYRQYQDSRLA